MARKANTEIVPAPQPESEGKVVIKTDFVIDATQLRDLRVAKIEEKLRAAINDTTKEVKTLSKEHEREQKQLINEVSSGLLESVASQLAAVNQANTAADLNVVTIAEVANVDMVKHEAKLVIKQKPKTGSGFDNDHYSQVKLIVVGTKFSVFTDEQKARCDAMNEKNAKVGELNETIIKLKRDLTNLPALARRAWARIVEMKLGEDEKGKQYLNELTADIDSLKTAEDIKGLLN